MHAARDERRAVERLQQVGLTEYEARCFVALSQITTGTARDVSDVSDIPRTRIYDLAESLQEQGLVEIRDGSPREFRAVSTDLAVEKLRRTHEEHLGAADDALRAVSTPDTDDSTGGVWAIEGRENVVERGEYIARRAEVELFGFFTEKAVFRDGCFRQAEYAIDRGVDVVLGSSDDALRADLRERFPAATIWSPSLDWESLETTGSQVSRLVMADRDIVMLGSIVDAEDGYEETAVWGEGDGNELVDLCRQLLGAQLDELKATDDPSGLPL